MDTDPAGSLLLRDPGEDLFEAFVEMAKDWKRAGGTRYQQEAPWTPARFGEYLRELRAHAEGRGLAPGKKPIRTFWLVQDGASIVGVSRLRPELNEELWMEGGHIGYDVPPSHRRQGYGTELLRRTLVPAREAGLRVVLLTCDKDNTGSRKIIEANGGILAGEGVSVKHGKALLRFWIVLAGAA
jgi:predicted acetyltransferase